MENASDRFCSQCGVSLVPLAEPHTIRSCATCGRDTHVREVGRDGGITIRPGDRFTIPAGALQVSLDPASRGKLFRPGLHFLLTQLFAGTLSSDKATLPAILEKLEKVSDTILENSALLKDLDLNAESDSKAAWERIEQNKDSREWFAALTGSFGQLAKKAIAEGETELAALYVHDATAAYAMTVALEPVFEETLWRGYLANSVVYEAVAATANTVAEQDAIRALDPLFQRLDEQTLHAWIDSNVDLGPRIGIKSVPEPVLRGLAKFHLAQFERRRADSLKAKQDAREAKELRIKWLSLGGAIATVIVSAIAIVLRVLKIP